VIIPQLRCFSPSPYNVSVSCGVRHEYRGAGSTFDRKKVIQTIYEASAPIPGPALDPQSEEFLRAVRLLAHDAIREGGGKLVSDVLGQPTVAHV
jgi:hypothetical protein